VTGELVPPNPDAVTNTVLNGGDSEIVALNRWVELNGEAAGPVFEALSRHPNEQVRDWVAVHARRAAYSGAIALLTRMAKDRSPIIQEVAIGQLIELDHEAANRTVVPRIRRMLERSTDDAARNVALWWLVRLNADHSIPLIRRMREEQATGADDAEFAELVLVGRGEEVLDVLRRHDHDRMLPAIRAAFAIRSESAIDALQVCADSAPDESCQRACRRVLNQVRAAQ
jgi:hypothetical protein